MDFISWLEASTHVGASGASGGPAAPPSNELLLNDSGELSPVHESSRGPGGGPGGGGGTAPAPTLVGSAGGLRIDLIWDKSAAQAPSGFTQAVIDAASTITKAFSNNIVINIDVGWGEIDGSPISSGDLGESENYGYSASYSAVTSALSADGYSFSAANEPTKSRFFVSSAEAKAFGMVGGSTIGSSSLDGYIGFGTLAGSGYGWNTTASTSDFNSGTGSNQFDLEAVAQHEITEVLGRIGQEGQGGYYTPLDLSDYASPGKLELSGAGGYFSPNGGASDLGRFNDSNVYGGDIADWASQSGPGQSATEGVGSGKMDAFDAFAWPGYDAGLSQSDLSVIAALGYTPTSPTIV